MRPVRNRLTQALLASLGLLVVVSCGGGGGGGGGPTAPPPPTAPIVFTGSGTGAANSASLSTGAGTSGSTLELELRVNGVQDLYGVAFNLEYPANLLRPAAGSTTGFLNSDGAQTSFISGLESPGIQVVGYTRLGAVRGVNGSGLLTTLRFTAIATGSGTLRFTQASAVDSRGEVIPGFTWSGGTVQVNQVVP